MKHKYIGVDIGGTNIACGIISDKGAILHKKSIKTESEKGYESIVKNVAALVTQMTQEANIPIGEIGGIGVGCPGLCNKNLGIVERAVNLNWYNVPLCADLEKATKLSVTIDNDANAAAYGEFVAGAAVGANSAIVITLGTGVGSGIIIDKKLYYGMNFAGGEIGHIVINANGIRCNCGRNGCFEAYSSATGLVRMTKEAIEQNPDSEMHRISEQNGKISARTAWQAAELKDRAGQEVVDKYIQYLACGLTNVINIFQPDIVCIGGGVCNEGDKLLIPLTQSVAMQVFSRDSEKNTELAICRLGNDAGIIGAAILAKT
ncbi:MAG: ROK family protein [Oscillospiraceae bacterium]|nr:ROK family protein [Oscillospiraceae bacterium]